MMEKFAPEELPVTLVIIMAAVPKLAISAAGTVAVIRVALTVVAANCVAPKVRAKVEVKLVP